MRPIEEHALRSKGIEIRSQIRRPSPVDARRFRVPIIRRESETVRAIRGSGEVQKTGKQEEEEREFEFHDGIIEGEMIRCNKATLESANEA